MNTELMELCDSARKALDAAGPAADENKTWPLALELGWLLVAVPETLGGLGQGLVGACGFHQEWGRNLTAAPALPALLSIDLVAATDHPDRAEWLERLTTRDYMAVSLRDDSPSVSHSPQGLRLDGGLSAVPSADRASHLLVLADDGAFVLRVPLATEGVTLLPRPTWDATRRLFDVRFSGAVVRNADVLAEGEAARALARRLAVHRDFALAADAVGGARTLLDSTVDYLKTRRQFGRPLALFQALKHRCADLQAQVVAADALLQDGLARVGDALDSRSAQSIGQAVKLQACTAYARVAEEALQLHGGIGMTAEHHCHLYLKRALLNEQLGRDGYELAIARACLESV